MRVRSVDEGPSSGMSIIGDAAVDLRCDIRDVLAAVDRRVDTRPGILQAEEAFKIQRVVLYRAPASECLSNKQLSPHALLSQEPHYVMPANLGSEPHHQASSFKLLLRHCNLRST